MDSGARQDAAQVLLTNRRIPQSLLHSLAWSRLFQTVAAE